MQRSIGAGAPRNARLLAVTSVHSQSVLLGYATMCYAQEVWVTEGAGEATDLFAIEEATDLFAIENLSQETRPRRLADRR